MQHKITTKGPLLNEKGHVLEAGYATELIKDYHRSQVKASKLRIKEWDYYIVMNDDYGVAFTVADNGYLGFISVTYFDFVKPLYRTYSKMKWFPMGRFRMPSSSQVGDVEYADKKMRLSFRHQGGGKRRILCDIQGFCKGDFHVDVTIEQEPRDKMVIVTPFDKNKKAFYYNQKINAMKATGTIHVNHMDIHLEDPTFATLDWGRGVWTYDNTWYWASASGKVQGHTFGMNLGYGFGNTSQATENMVFVDGIGHKLDEVTFHIPTNPNGKDDFLSPWTFTSNDGRLELKFQPILDRADKVNVLFLVSDQHQTFGHYSGTVTLDDGTVLQIEDLLGFAEKVHNKW
jgi:hypothetical protein